MNLFFTASKPTPRQLSRELREENTPDLARRRWIIGLSFLGVLIAKIVGLYQMGILRRLPDLPLPFIDSNKVNASDYAYKRVRTPDAFPMLVSYATTAWLAAVGGKDRASTSPALPIALGLKTLADTAVAAELGREEWKDNKALCAYCQTATLISIGSVALALPEAWRALQRLWNAK